MSTKGKPNPRLRFLRDDLLGELGKVESRYPDDEANFGGFTDRLYGPSGDPVGLRFYSFEPIGSLFDLPREMTNARLTEGHLDLFFAGTVLDQVSSGGEQFLGGVTFLKLRSGEMLCAIDPDIVEVAPELIGGSAEPAPASVAAIVEKAREAGANTRPRVREKTSTGVIHITAAQRMNCQVTVWDGLGNSVGFSDSGKTGFRSTARSSVDVVRAVVQDAVRQAIGCGLEKLEVRFSGAVEIRDAAVRAIVDLGIEVLNARGGSFTKSKASRGTDSPRR